jgi:hypothetical protein
MYPFVNIEQFYVKHEERLCPAYSLKHQYSVVDELDVAEEETMVLAEVMSADGRKEVKKVPMFADRFTTIEHQQTLMQLQLQQQEA